MTFRNDKSIIYVNAYYIPEEELCPTCGSSFLSKNGYTTKTVKHCVYYTSLFIVTCHIQCYKCKECKTIFYEKDTFSNPYETLSKESIFVILDKLKYANTTFQSVARDLLISRQDVINVFDRYVDYSPETIPSIICLDEKHINKSMTDNAYIFVILDFVNIKIYDILYSRHKHVIERYFSRIPLVDRQRVKYIIIDMWEPYKDACIRYFRNALIAIDSFHVIKAVNYAMDRVRISVMQRYNQHTDILDDNHAYYYLLKKYSYLFLMEFDDINDKRFYIKKLKGWYDKYSLRTYLLSIDNSLNHSYSLASRYREFNRTARFETCKEELELLINDFYNSKLSQFIDVGKTLSNWKEYIINSFIIVNGRRLSNGAIEGYNATIEKINRNGNGYNNFYRFRNRVIYVINKDVAIRNIPIKQKVK